MEHSQDSEGGYLPGQEGPRTIEPVLLVEEVCQVIQDIPARGEIVGVSFSRRRKGMERDRRMKRSDLRLHSQCYLNKLENVHVIASTRLYAK